MREQSYFSSVHQFSVSLSARHGISSKDTGLNLTKLAISLPLSVRVCGSSFIFPSGICTSVHYAIFSQTSGRYDLLPWLRCLRVSLSVRLSICHAVSNISTECGFCDGVLSATHSSCYFIIIIIIIIIII